MHLKRSRLTRPGGVDDRLGMHASSAVLVAGIGAVAGTKDAHHIVVAMDLVIESIFVATATRLDRSRVIILGSSFLLRDWRHVVGNAARDGGLRA